MKQLENCYLLLFNYSCPDYSPLLSYALHTPDSLKWVPTLLSITMGPLYMFLH